MADDLLITELQRITDALDRLLTIAKMNKRGRLTMDGVETANSDGELLDKTVDTITWERETAAKSGYDRYMRKGIGFLLNEAPYGIEVRCVSAVEPVFKDEHTVPLYDLVVEFNE